MTIPENTTSPWGLPYPSGVGRVNLGATDFNELATRLNTVFNEKFLVVKTSAVEITAKAGELVEMTAAGTVNLPKAAAANTIVGVFAQKGEVTVKTTSAEKIVGGALPEAGTSITLGTGQFAVVQYDGTRYLVVAGVPKEYIGDTQVVKGRALIETENAYGAQVSRTSETEYEPSATRSTFVVLTGNSSTVGGLEPTINMTVFVGGVNITTAAAGRASSQSPLLTVSFICPPKVKWKAKIDENATLTSSYLIL